MRWKGLILGLAALALLAPLGPARAASGAECIVEMARAETEARVAFETGLADLVRQADPEQAELAEMSRDLQVMLARDRLDRVTFLAETRPRAFAAETGAVDWTDGDEAAYIAEPAHAERMARAAALQAEIEADPGFPALQEFFARVIARLFEFQKLMVDHNAARRAASDAFAECRAGG